MNIATPVNALAAEFDRAELVTALAAACRTVEKRNSIPILSNVRLVVSPLDVTLTGTDLDQTAEIHVKSATCIASGAVTVAAHQLLKLLKPMKADSVSMELGEGDTLNIVAGRSRLALPTLPVADFPSEPMTGDVTSWEMPGQDLARLISKAALGISTEETRFYLNGIFLHVSGDQFKAVATDGHRLAHVTADAMPEGALGMVGAGAFGFDHHGHAGFILPRKACHELLALIGKSQHLVTVDVKRTRIIFEGFGWKLTTKKIEGSFPDYQRVLPRTDKTLVVLRDSLDEAIKAVSAIAADRMRAVKFAVAGKELTLSCRNPDAGTASETVDVTFDSAEPFEIGFNAAYVKSILDEITDAHVAIHFADYGTPARFNDPADDNAFFVLMPLRI
jgi:DNA polymerase-3 subunit beta